MIPNDFDPHRKLASRAQARSVLDETVVQCHRLIRIFDDRGEFYGFERKAFCDALAALLGRSRESRAVLVLQDTGHLEQNCPRFMQLLRRFAPRLKVLQTDANTRTLVRGLVIADHGVLMTRPHFDQGITYVDYDESAVMAAGNLFAEIEREAGNPLSGHVTGL